MRKTKTTIIFLLLIIVSLPLYSCQRKYPAKSGTGFYFDTIVSIAIHDNNISDKQKSKLLEECMNMCDYYDKLLSSTITDSDIYAINHANGKSVVVHEDTFFLIETAVEYAKLTNGRIDPTISKVSDLWTFRQDNGHIPSQTDIQDALKHVDYTKILLDKNNLTVTLSDPDATIGLGFIAKGFIADKIKDYLLNQSVKNASINLGGNLLFLGKHSDGKSFTAGIQMPFSENGTLAATITLKDKSLVTSGTYQRYFSVDNIIYHHILDTATGMPLNNDLLSVSILTDSSLHADALSTTCFIMGLEEGLNYINSLENVEALFITSDYQLHYSNGFVQQ